MCSINGTSKKLLLVGSYTDSILFQLAIEVAKHGQKVWFLANKPFETIPKEVQHECKEYLELITFIYLSTFEELVKLFNGIHKRQQVPSVIILKGLDQFCNFYSSVEEAYDARTTAYLIASILDGMLYLNRKNSNKTSLLLVSCYDDENNLLLNERLKTLYDMYFDECLYEGSFVFGDVLNKIAFSLKFNI
ncbi:hypothetical protein ABEB36_004791 [Hypothenemus hampei]|uniref:Uncharacterized protein n=1 Tax=Hypothenemus hampei TaxID=57062 RepID=A0ABD1EZR9_HYPHA